MRFIKTISENNLFRDFGVVVLSIVVAIILVKTGALNSLLVSTEGLKLFGSFVAGVFFTSIFTTAPAMVALGEIARSNSLWGTALSGGCGAMLGDLVIFRFVKNSLATDFSFLVNHHYSRRLAVIFRMKFFRWFIAFLGALIIASPLPDELGLAMMGLTKIRVAVFLPISFALNTLGILIVGLVAKSL
jgi:hypothetical protein